MLLPAILKTILLYGGLAFGGFAVLLFSVLRDEKRAKEANAGNLPEASIKGANPRMRRWWPWATLAFGGLLVYLMLAKTTDVIVVFDDGPTRKVRLFGSSDYQPAPGFKPQAFLSDDPTWVVNESSRIVKVKTVNYGRTLGWGGIQPMVIPPGTAAAFSRIDHIGRLDSPPSQVQDKYKLGMDSRNWLIWD